MTAIENLDAFLADTMGPVTRRAVAVAVATGDFEASHAIMGRPSGDVREYPRDATGRVIPATQDEIDDFFGIDTEDE